MTADNEELDALISRLIAPQWHCESLRNEAAGAITALRARVAELEQTNAFLGASLFDFQERFSVDVPEEAGKAAKPLLDQLQQVKADTESYRRRLAAIFPLFEEARDALTAIPLASAKLHNVRLDLADRMDDVGDPKRWAETESRRNDGTA